MRTWLFVLALASCSWTTHARAGWLLRDEPLRYDRALLPTRILADVVSLPLELGRLTPQDGALFSLYAYAVVALMLPDGASLDARMQFQLNADLGQPRAKLWTQRGDAVIWATISTALAGQWFYGWLRDQPRRMQMVSLMIEAMAVAQLYHLGLKLALGREGPDDAQGLGLIHGPGARAFRQFPSGTPSGHAITAYAFLGVAVGFIEERWARVALHLGAMAFAASLVIDNYHFVSDVLVGAAAGYGIGRWVGRHRATAGASVWYDDFVAVPYVDPWRQGGGVAILFPLP